MNGPKISVSFRVAEDVLDRVNAVLNSDLPELHSMTDVFTDALWLWLYEDEKVYGPRSADRVGAASSPKKGEEAEEGLVEGLSTDQERTGDGSESVAVPETV
jgi:hypothetical protein